MHFERRGLAVKVTQAPGTHWHRVIYTIPDHPPLVSLIVPTKDHVTLLRDCIDGILDRTDYRQVEIIIVDNQSQEPETLAYLKAIGQDARVSVLTYDAQYNFPAINNMAFKFAKGEIIGLLNDDLRIISPGWLGEMVSHAVRPEVGIVGARLYYPNDTIQHAGVILGIGGVAGHPFKHERKTSYGYFGRTHLIQDYSCVTAACILLRREVYERCGGLDEQNLPVAFNDVDFCIRVRELGYRILWTPYAELCHLESVTRGSDDTPKRRPGFKQEVEYMRTRWATELATDPFYNPNLSLTTDDFSLACPSRVERPWREPGR